jgi:hypothetical protein
VKTEAAWKWSQQYETNSPSAPLRNELSHLYWAIETLDEGRRRLPKEITEYSSNKIKRLFLYGLFA